MDIEVNENDPGVVTLRGRFDANEAPRFRECLETIVGEGHPRIELIMRAVTFVDSTALAEVIRVHKSQERWKRELVVREPSDVVRVILQLTRLDAVLHCESSAESGASVA